MQVTERDLQILWTVERYKFIPTSLLLALIRGSKVVIRSRLRKLYDQGLLNRITLALHTEDVYYLDNVEALRLLCRRTRLQREELDWNAVRNNRRADYANAFKPLPITQAWSRRWRAGQMADNSQPPGDRHRRQTSTAKLDHELMISRFHFMLERAATESGGQVVLHTWRQGPEIWSTVQMPKLVRSPAGGWEEDPAETEEHPHRPDAFFTLRFPDNPPEREFLHYFYEADNKGSTNLRNFLLKLRRHFHYVVRQHKHHDDYQVDRVRAVLTETLDRHWAEHLLTEASAWSVTGRHNPSPLFWFLPSELFLRPQQVTEGKQTRVSPHYLVEPSVVFKPLWATPLSGPKLCSLLDH